MEFHHSDTANLGFRRIHPLLAELIRSIPDTIDPGKRSQAAEERLFPDPTTEDADDLDDIRSDWKSFVQPELQDLFQSARAVVISDLRGMQEEEASGQFSFEIPVKHLDAWLNVLNQARLTLASEIGFDEHLLASTDEIPDLLSERGLLVFRINLFAFMQQCLIEQVD